MSRHRFTAALAATIVAVAAVALRGADSPRALTLVALGDPRFTDPVNVKSSDPRARAALVARIADEQPDAILIAGDLPWHGGAADDYDRFRQETAVWRSRHLRVISALGNHELSRCDVPACLEHWWQAFPDLRGKRWYSSTMDGHVEVLALDSTSPLTVDSEQRVWLEREVDSLPHSVEFVIVLLHHPPVADVQTRVLVDHNPRPNEIALAEYLGRAAPSHRARFVVVSGHVHNYERLVQDGVMYVTSGGGGAQPYAIDRTPVDLYQATDFPNYQYLRMTIAGSTLKGEMCRLDEAAAPEPHFTVKDSFEVTAPSAP